MLDLFPDSAEVIIDFDGLNVLESKSQSINYIDVAEDCIKLLNKLAEQCPNEVMGSECAMNFINFIDFFDKNVQGTIMNMIRHFFGVGVWNKNIKKFSEVVVNKCNGKLSIP